ncbi:MAG: hypothetical protein WA126_00795, partial [Thermodesulfovibrionales bacterium]
PSTYSGINRNVDGFPAESLDGMPRNQWSTCSGMTGRLGPEYAFSLIAYFLAIIAAFLAYGGCDKWTYLSTIAIILTGAILIWYTWETNLLRSEAQRQTELQLRPFVIIVPEQNCFQLRNIGNGPALNVSVADVILDPNDDVKIQFSDYIPFLSKDDSFAIKAEGYHKGKPVGDFFNAHLYKEYANRILKLVIEFQNVESQAYVVEETVSPGKLTIDGIQSRKRT